VKKKEKGEKEKNSEEEKKRLPAGKPKASFPSS